MHNSASFRKPFLSERINYFQKLLKSSEKYFFSYSFIILSQTELDFRSDFKFQISGFRNRSKILGLLVNNLTVNREYSGSNRDNLQLRTQITLSKKEYTFCDIFFAFLVYRWNFQWSVENMSLIIQAFLKLSTPKDVLI